jgi:hypothetical protein
MGLYNVAYSTIVEVIPSPMRRMDPLQFKEFALEMRGALEKNLGVPLTEQGLRSLQYTVDEEFCFSRERNDFLLPYDGMAVVGGKIYTTSRGRAASRVELQWVTDFYPGRRYSGQEGSVMPLGFFGTYDLYLGFQDPLPPTLIARYGHAPHEYATQNPFLADLVGEPFFEAWRRAQFLNMDWREK